VAVSVQWGKENPTLLYSDSPLLQAMAFADGAIFGYDSLDDLWDQQVPANQNELPLRWKDSALEQPILRNVHQAHGVLDVAWLQSAFTTILRALLDICGYFCEAAIHMIRRYLGKQVGGR
jgi:hypothetical protein